MGGLLNILQGWLPSMIVMTAISVTYFVTDKTPSKAARLVSAAHGLIGAILLGGAIFIWQSGRSNDAFAEPYTLLLLLPVASVVFSFFFYRGRKLVHLLQIPNSLCLLWAFFIGSMAVSGNWL